jgi:hypothetical protein
MRNVQSILFCKRAEIEHLCIVTTGKMTMRDVGNEARARPVYTKLGAADIPLSSVALNSLVQRDVRGESVVISPPSIAAAGSVVSRDFDEKPKSTPSSSGIGVNIHRSKQGVFVVR